MGGGGAKRTEARQRHLVALAGMAVGIAALAFFVGVLASPRGGAAQGLWYADGMPRMRVLLALDAESVAVEVRGPYAIHAVAGDPADGEVGAEIDAGAGALAETRVRAAGGRLSLGGRALEATAVVILPREDGALLVGGRGYRGDLLVVAAKGGGSVTAVNRVPLEAYTVGVLGGEMPLGFPEPSLAAQSVAARTYGLFHHLRRRGKGLYDVRDDASSQVYKGLAVETDKARRVVESTFGLVLSFDGKPLQTYFHSTCGGDTIPAQFVFGERDIPPFRGAPCGFCNDSKYAQWEVELGRDALAERLARHGIRAPIDGVRVSRGGPAGHVAEVEVAHAGGRTALKASAFRMAVGPSVIRATRFQIEEAAGGVFRIRGRGWGHAVGLCQIGARGMAREGHGAESILRHYYPGADLVRIYDRTVAR